MRQKRATGAENLLGRMIVAMADDAIEREEKAERKRRKKKASP